MVRRTWASTTAMLSPGRMRKLTTARASAGSTLSLTPAWMMVTAVVVRRVAFEAGEGPRGGPPRRPENPGVAAKARGPHGRPGGREGEHPPRRPRDRGPRQGVSPPAD